MARSNDGIFISQSNYALDLSHEIGMSVYQPIDMSLEEDLKLWSNLDQSPCDKEEISTVG